MTLHADVSDADGDTTSVWWFVDAYSAATGKSEHVGIGVGKDLKWQIPVNLYGSTSLNNFFVAVQDSKGGMGEKTLGMSISGEQEYIDVIAVTQSPNPADVGGPVTMTAELGIITPGDVKVVFKVNDQTEVPSTAAVQTELGNHRPLPAYGQRHHPDLGAWRLCKALCDEHAVRGEAG